MKEFGGNTVTDDAREVHVPVAVSHVLELLCAAGELDRGGLVVDATVGAGGHSERILQTYPSCQLLGLDQDPDILEIATERLEPFGDRVRLERARHSDLGEILAREGDAVRALLLDLGASSLQLDRAERGFSFMHDGPLDMRMDPDRERTAADVVNSWDEEDLADLIYHEGDESRARHIARAIVEFRRRAPFRRTMELADLIARVGARGRRGGRMHPATRTFQALRRAVNEEGEELASVLQAAEEYLPDGARLLVISFHSGEDRVVKRFFAEGGREQVWDVLTRKPRMADAAEERANSRARSLRLRAAVRLRPQGEVA